MSKAAVTRLFFGGIVAVVAGWVLAIATVVAALAGGAVVIGGPSGVTINGGPFAAAVAVLAIAWSSSRAAPSPALVAWIGALAATARLEDKTWFVMLLVLGVWSFGFVAMLAYVLAGPDGTERPATGRDMATAPGA